jgi:hypothetical protein
MARRTVDPMEKKLYAIYTLKWCKKHLGVNKRKKGSPKFSFRLTFSDKDLNDYGFPVCGHYCHETNKIVIYNDFCETIESVVSTTIHEYTHYLQPTSKHFQYLKSYYYSHNPLEKEAFKNEIKYTKKCLRMIKKELQNL